MSSSPGEPIEIFFSYAREDEDLKIKLEKHLSILKRQGVINNWSDRQITAGEEWSGKIDSHINSSQIILLLVSADFLASDYCFDIEVKQGMARHEKGEARVIPVILRPCDWVIAPFGKLQALPKDGKALTSWTNLDDALLNVAEGVRKVVEELTRPSPAVSSPQQASNSNAIQSMNYQQALKASSNPVHTSQAPVVTQMESGTPLTIETTLDEIFGSDDNALARTDRHSFRSVALDMATNNFYVSGDEETTSACQLPDRFGLYYQRYRDFLTMTSYVKPVGFERLRSPALGNDPGSGEEFAPESWIFVEESGRIRQVMPATVPGPRHYDLREFASIDQLFLVTLFRGVTSFRDGTERIWIEVRDFCGSIQRLSLSFGGTIRFLDFQRIYTFPHKFPLEFYSFPTSKTKMMLEPKTKAVEQFQNLMGSLPANRVRNTDRSQADWTAVEELWREMHASDENGWTGIQLSDVQGDVVINASGETLRQPASKRSKRS